MSGAGSGAAGGRARGGPGSGAGGRAGGADPGRVAVGGPAHERLLTGLLAWRQPRPREPDGLAEDLRDRLESGLRTLDTEVTAAAAASRDGSVRITKTGLTRLACDGWARDPRPYEHTRANARGVLTHRVVEQDWRTARTLDPAAVVGRVWHEEATRRPGDPASLSRWLNDQPSEAADELRQEIADLLVAFREVWPLLPTEQVRARLEEPLVVRLAGGRVVLRGVPDLVLTSPRRDDRLRTLVVDLKTGLPRPDQDRAELRFYALLVTLAHGRPPFRWATFHVTEGRAEHEDLRPVILERAVARVLDGVRQAARLATHPDDTGLTIRGGGWCRFCRREDTCAEAAAARARAEAELGRLG